jgi:hypothetical protein
MHNRKIARNGLKVAADESKKFVSIVTRIPYQ